MINAYNLDALSEAIDAIQEAYETINPSSLEWEDNTQNGAILKLMCLVGVVSEANSTDDFRAVNASLTRLSTVLHSKHGV